MCPSTNEYWSVEPGTASREVATHHVQGTLSGSAERSGRGARDAGDAAADLQPLGIALCALSTLMMGSVATLALLYLF